MRKILFIICLLVSQLGFGQTCSYNYNSYHSIYQSYCYPFDYSDSTLLDTIIFQNTTNNIWQIGQPNKTFFNSASSLPKVIVTDTINTYPVNDTSYFIINHSHIEIVGIVSFNFKVDSDSLLDIGTLEFSIDSGQTWNNFLNNDFIDWTVRQNPYTGSIISSFINGVGDTITPFTGKKEWLFFSAIIWYPNSWHPQPFPVSYRFGFISDSIDTQQEGWMLDNIYMSSTIIFNTSNPSTPKFPSKVIPNPSVKEQVWLQFDNDSYNKIIVEIYTVTGQLLQQHTTREGEIPIQLKEKGVYFYRLRNEETQEISLGKFGYEQIQTSL